MEIDRQSLMIFFGLHGSWENKHDRTFSLKEPHTNKTLMIVKKNRLPSKVFAIPFDDVVFLSSNFRFESGGDLWEVIIPQIGFIVSNSDQVLATGVSIYRNQNKIFMAGCSQVTVDQLAQLDFVVNIHYPDKTRAFVMRKFYQVISSFKSLDDCKMGFFHGDLHSPNVLMSNNVKHVVDFDDICISHIVLNIVQPFYVHAVKEYIREGNVELFSRRKATFFDSLSAADADNFWNFVRLYGYYWETRVIPFRQSDHELRYQELVKWFREIDEFVETALSGRI